jgi:hypothetical protein
MEVDVNDIRVESWMELVKTLYDDIPQNRYGRYRSDFVYRGLADQSWGLKTSLMRLDSDHYENLERPLLRNFKKYAEPGSLPPGTLWTLLSVAQHHGLPTRLLDWTASPRVAVHFATAEEEHYDKDAAIWCINVAAAHGLLPRELLAVLDREYAFLFSVEMLELIQKLSEFDSLAGRDGFILFFEPPSLDSRIVNQMAIMSVMPGPRLLLSEFLRNHPDLYHRVIIPKELKWEVRDKLDQDNVTERMLFPGLDGLSRWLKRYYGLGPDRPQPPVS